ncbi:hypothetical protein [Paracoccus sp. IB05]|nr:hypothetical protein [Paracoccus sp. IB05]MBJ2153661.1 hypothetical protein [Paracoccus sp. IB05]
MTPKEYDDKLRRQSRRGLTIAAFGGVGFILWSHIKSAITYAFAYLAAVF